MHDMRWKQLFTAGGRQEQVVSVSQAVECGIPRSTFVQAAHRLGMANLGGGVWAQCGAPNTYRRKLWVVKLSLGDDLVFTGRTALWLRRIITSPPAEVDIFSADRALRSCAGRRSFRGAWDDRDATLNIEGFATASINRAFRDAAAVVPLESLLRWIPAMDRLRLGSVDELAGYLDTCGRFPGVVNLRAAVAALRADLPHSGAERFARKVLRAADLAPHPRPYPVRDRGATIAEIDLAYPRVLYGIEVDGPHHRLTEVAQADRVRDRKLHRLGWTIDRYTVEEIQADPAGFVREVRRALKARSG